MRQINQAGIDLIKQFEGCVLDAYLDSVSIPSIAYGHIEGVQMGDSCTQEQADAWLASDIQHTATAVDDAIAVHISDNQFAALVCLSYNIGITAFKNSTLLKLLNEGNVDDACLQFVRWDRAGGLEVQGLLNRRIAEQALFNES
jgi:lysozyme